MFVEVGREAAAGARSGAVQRTGAPLLGATLVVGLKAEQAQDGGHGNGGADGIEESQKRCQEPFSKKVPDTFSLRNNSDVRARYNLAWVYQREKNFPAALEIIAEALSLDKMGQYRDRLLQKHSEVVAQQVQRHQTEYLLLVNLVSKYAAAKEEEKAKTDVAVAEPAAT